MTALPRGALLVTISECRDGATWNELVRYTIPVTEAREWKRRARAIGHRRITSMKAPYPARFVGVVPGARRVITLTKGGDCP